MFRHRRDGLIKIVAAFDAPGRECAVVNRFRTVWHDEPGVNAALRAEAVAIGTRAMRTIKRKHARLKLRVADTAVDAGQFLAEQHFRAIHDTDADDPFAQFHGKFDRIGDALAQAIFHDKAVNHDINVVLFILFQHDFIRQLAHFAIHADADVALFLQILEDLAIFPFASAHHRRENLEFRSFREREDFIHHLLHGLRRDFLAALPAMRLADAGEQQAEVVVNFRHRSNSGTRVAADGFLFDGNGRRQAFDGLHIRLFHLI